jgi:hypothetical protein
MHHLRGICSNYFLNPVFFCFLYLIPANTLSQAEEKTKAEDVVATQLRAQGIPCTKPTRAEKDTPDSRPDEMTWIISCKEATYKVTLIPHIGAKIDIVDPSDFQSEAKK